MIEISPSIMAILMLLMFAFGTIFGWRIKP